MSKDLQVVDVHRQVNNKINRTPIIGANVTNESQGTFVISPYPAVTKNQVVSPAIPNNMAKA